MELSEFNFAILGDLEELAGLDACPENANNVFSLRLVVGGYDED